MKCTFLDKDKKKEGETINLETHINIDEKNNKIICSLYSGIDLVSCCGLIREESEWTIFKWNTFENYQQHGYGKLVMCSLLEHCMESYGKLLKIKYIWNGQNDYVGEWLKNFDAKCCCPMIILKNNSDDDWESHIYSLNVVKFLQYFEIR